MENIIALANRFFTLFYVAKLDTELGIKADKQAHFLSCLMLAFGTALLFGLFVPNLLAAVLAFAFWMLLAAAKECIYDAAHPDIHTVDFYDFIAGVCGALAGIGLFLLTVKLA